MSSSPLELGTSSSTSEAVPPERIESSVRSLGRTSSLEGPTSELIVIHDPDLVGGHTAWFRLEQLSTLLERCFEGHNLESGGEASGEDTKPTLFKDC